MVIQDTARRTGGKARRRAELAQFLRARRERLSPEQVGLPPGPRRRTPGLRREELALLAGVGITWYTWLEQGRPINASMQVLDAVARTLRLDLAEREHLYRLAEATPLRTFVDSAVVPTVVLDILSSFSPCPAVLVNGRFDVLESNDGHQALDAVYPPEPAVVRDHRAFGAGEVRQLRRRSELPGGPAPLQLLREHR
jgi:transcriptional regulator with XRE-family HTH domain